MRSGSAPPRGRGEGRFDEEWLRRRRKHEEGEALHAFAPTDRRGVRQGPQPHLHGSIIGGAFYQCLGPYAWGGNLWQHPASGIPARVILPPVHR
jgi:hypothetical protein